MKGNLQTLPSPTDIEMQDKRNSTGLSHSCLSGSSPSSLIPTSDRTLFKRNNGTLLLSTIGSGISTDRCIFLISFLPLLDSILTLLEKTMLDLLLVFLTLSEFSEVLLVLRILSELSEVLLVFELCEPPKQE